MHGRFSFRNKNELLGKADELGLELPYSDDISPLFRPVQIEKFNVTNRLVVQPMEGYDSEADGSPSELTRRRYLRYATGGSGIIWFEAVAVSADGRSNPGQLWINKDNKDHFRYLNEKIRSAAAKTGQKPMLVIQLTHSGRYSKPDYKPHPLVAAGNSILDKTEPHILSDTELLQIRDNYMEASRNAVSAGFDAIDIKACHGYLMIDLLAAKERKNSMFGGVQQNRFSLMLEIMDRIKQDNPGTIVTTRLNISDMYPGGFTAEDSLQLTAELALKGVTLINLSMGSPYFNPHVTRPYDTPLPGQSLPDEHPLEGVIRMINDTAQFSKKFPKVHFVGSAYSWLRQYAPNVGAEVVRRGYASLIGFGRSSFAYPDLPADLKETGKANPAKVCITCSGCTRLIRNFRPGGCVIRDKEIYGTELKKLIADGK